MPEKPKKKRLMLRAFFSTLVVLILVFAGAYFTLKSPRFYRFIFNRINQSIPGRIAYDQFYFNLERSSLRVRNLRYLNVQGERAFAVDALDIKFKLRAAFRGRLEIEKLGATTTVVNMANFPETEGPSQWRTTLKIILKRLSILDGHINALKFTLKDDSRVHLEDLDLSLTKQILQNQKIQLKLKELKVQQKAKDFTAGPINFAGSIDTPIIREFNFFVSEAKGQLAVENLEVPGLEEATLKTEIQINGDTLKLIDGKLKNQQIEFDIDAKFDSSVPAIGLEIKNEQPIIFGAIPKASQKLQTTFTGFKIDLKAQVEGKKLNDLNGSIDLVVDALGNRSHDNTPDHKLTLKGKFNKGVLKFTLFEIVSEIMQLKGTGNVDLAKQNFDVQIDTHDFDITTLVNTLAEIDLTGYADAKGTITGTFKNPNFYMKAQAREAGYSFMNYGEVDGVFKIENGVLSFVGGSPQGVDYFTKVDVRTDDLFKKSRKTTLNAEFRDLDAGKLLINEDYQGKVDGTFNMVVSQNDKQGKLKATIDNFGFYNFQFTKVEAEGQLLKDQFIINPVNFQPPDYENLTMPEPIVFRFGDKGWSVKGTLLKGATLEGKFLESQPSKVNVDFALKNVDLRPVLASMGFPVQESFADGDINIIVGLDKAPSSINMKFSRFNIPMEDGFIRNDGLVELEIKPPKINFKNVSLLSGEGTFSIEGTYNMEGPLSLDLNGKVNLGVLKFYPKYFREAEGYADLNLKIGGTAKNPQPKGKITFSNAGLTLRPIRGQIENLSGSLNLTGDAVIFEKLTGTMREGDLIINGQVGLKNLTPTFYDLKIETREVAIAEPGLYKLIFSGDFSLKGPPGKALLSGIMDINDGVYSRDFSLTQSLLKPKTPSLKKAPSEFLKDIELNLRIRSPGQLAIKNNIARIYFNSDLTLTGPALHPEISGALEVLNGELSYFTVDFQDAQGTIDFRDPKSGPYVNITLEKSYRATFEDVTVYANIEGFTDNLQLSLNSSPPLERKDIQALVFTGALPGDARRNLSGSTLASTVLAAQLSQLIQKPLARRARLDIFRLEATDPEQTSAITRLAIGKKLTDRLSLEFKTDLGGDKPLQGIQAEYLLLDNILLKGTQFSDGEFEYSLALRFLLF